ncbi:hypothetical protein ABPG75_012703 [Micractinium tetrahymenae]
MLGYPAGIMLPYGAFGQAAAPLLHLFWTSSCKGSETNLSQCDLDLSAESCDLVDESFTLAAAVACLDSGTPEPADARPAITGARLANGTSPASGRLEVQYFGSIWGTVCGARFDSTVAAVACRMLGFDGGGAAITGGT